MRHGKRFIFYLCIFCIGILACPNLFATPGSISEQANKIASDNTQSPDELIDNIDNCVRTFIEGKVAAKKGVELAALYISQTEKSLGDASKLSEISNSCSTELKRLRPFILLRHPALISRVDQLRTLNQLKDVSPKAKQILTALVSPKTVCDKVGIGASVAALLAIGVKVDSAHCKGTNGRSWIEISPGIAVGGGIGVEADINLGCSVRNGFYHALPISGSLSDILTVGTGFEIRAEDFQEGKGSAGLGLGIGYGILKAGQANLKIIPLGIQKHYLASALKGGNTDPLALPGSCVVAQKQKAVEQLERAVNTFDGGSSTEAK